MCHNITFLIHDTRDFYYWLFITISKSVLRYPKKILFDNEEFWNAIVTE